MAKNVEIYSNKLAKDYKVALISDIHIWFIYNKNFIQHVAEKINQINPDFVLLPGDLVDNIDWFDQDVIDAFNSIKAPIYMTFGNHDNYAWAQQMRAILAKTKMQIVQDLSGHKAVFDSIGIYGIDDASSLGTWSRFNWDTKDIVRVLQDFSVLSTWFNIIMSHQPVGIEQFSDKWFDLLVAWHTHGGQIFPFNFMVNTMYKYFRWEYIYHEMDVIVSQWLGTRWPALRFGTNSEIVVIDLKVNK